MLTRQNLQSFYRMEKRQDIMTRLEVCAWEKHQILPSSQFFRAFSPSNIALIKYWGKRDVALNLPTHGSISVTLKDFGSYTTAEFSEHFTKDEFYLNGTTLIDFSKAIKTVDELRKLAQTSLRVRVQSYNNFPTAAGLASSASGMSALTYACARALDLNLSLEKLSEISRKTSGSSCRSFFDGFVEWNKGELADGSDCVAHSIVEGKHFPLQVFLVVVQEKPKHHPSTDGMLHTQKTSPFFEAWVKNSEKDFIRMKKALFEKDFESFSMIIQENCFRMHACMMASSPPLLYWEPQTLLVTGLIESLQKSSIPVCFTIDAGPNVVVLCPPEVRRTVHEELKKLNPMQLLSTILGSGTRAYNLQEWQNE